MDNERQPLTVGAGQILVDADITINAERILAMMQHAAEQDVELLVLPETALTGYSPTIGHGRQSDEWPIIAQALRRIAKRSADLSIWTVVGSEALASHAWVNRLYAMSPEGKVVATYDKVHLMDNDVPYYQGGQRVAMFEAKGWRVGLQICYDVRFPEGYRELLHGGAELIVQGFYGAGGNSWKLPVLDAHIVSRAAESGCFVVATNVANPQPILTTQIVDPLGIVLAKAAREQPGLAVATLEAARIAESEIRRNYLERHKPTNE